MSANEWFLASVYPGGVILAFTPHRHDAIAAAREWVGDEPGYARRATVDGPDSPQGPGFVGVARCRGCGAPDTVNEAGVCPDCARTLANREPSDPRFDI